MSALVERSKEKLRFSGHITMFILLLLHYITLTSSKSLLRFHSASEYGVMHGDRPVVQRQVETKTASTIDEVVPLNLPHTIDNNAMVKSSGGINKFEEDRKPTVLRGEEEAPAIEPAVQPQPNYVLIGSTNQQVEPQQQILHAAEVLDVSQAEDRPRGRNEDVLRNSLSQVEVIPTDVVPLIITTSSTPQPTIVTDELSTTLATSEDPPTSPKVYETEVENLPEKVKEKGHEFVIVNELPTGETFTMVDSKAVIPTVVIKGDLSEAVGQKEAVVEAIDSEKVNTPRFDQKSREEEEDAVALAEFDEKTDTDLEFHEDNTEIATTKSTETATTTSEPETTTSTILETTEVPVQDITITSSEFHDKDYLSEEDIYDLIMFLITLLPEVEERSTWSKIIAGLQCALRDCRRAFPYLTTVPTPVGNGTFIIRRARSECLCSISSLFESERP